jgi:F-type H+-transporting ATPase subunit alpha
VNPGDAIRETLEDLRALIPQVKTQPRSQEIGRVLSTGDGIARLAGLPGCQSQELLDFGNGAMGIAFNLDEDEVGAVLLGESDEIGAGGTVTRTEAVVRVPVGPELPGRIIDPLGTVLDNAGDLAPERYEPIERDAPPILARSAVTRPLATGIKAVDTMIPIGRGQRELIIGDRSTGKTTVAMNAILNQVDSNVICVYVAIGQRASSVARTVETFRSQGALPYTVVVVADADSPPGLRYIAPYAGASIAEYFAERGRDTLVVYDDLTKHAQTYREISLLLRRPPGREAYPGDVFYLHSRLLERAGQWDEAHGGGSQTALPIVETQDQNISAYIPTNLISITDGQIYMNPDLYQSGMLPAVDIGLSVSRVGGKTQIQAMKKLAQSIRLAYTQFSELEKFAKFGTTMDAGTKKTLEKGRRIRELLKQSEVDTVSLGEQVLLLHVADRDLLAAIEPEKVRDFERRFRELARTELADLLARIAANEKPDDKEIEEAMRLAERVVNALAPEKSEDTPASG